MRILLASLLAVIISCPKDAVAQPKHSAPEKNVSTDRLIAAWNKSWNDRDSAAITSQLTNDAVMLSSAKTMNGRSQIAKQFVSHYYRSMLNLKTRKFYESAGGNIAVQSGTYTHDIQTAEGKPNTLSGGYTFVWELQADKSWKLRFLELE
ncbi:nuclear transport factor 2 family protein [Flaviaesturariibacter flavus]|uniref:Nuclear transport factor 2 family protein n=1 Tax=Flaviaesturariibacter flavus TaxID=2502780 RepID=A0A4R1B237_9BACT|nr:nuclear transport factor 2 family protein [Flaviaesturariibacter flavus]TCJ12112.1 nuclear transport factor 2 family protein [Flaviaesturariibacter flavus]